MSEPPESCPHPPWFPAVTAEPTRAVDQQILAELQSMLGYSAADMSAMIEEFGQNAEELLAELTRALAGARLADARRAAHTLKSTANAVGAIALGHLAADLEGLSKNSRAEAAAQRLAELGKEYERAMLGLRRAVREQSGNPG
jgi:HPt (histidine-containing phosphotransfer) domain-containing protein